MGGGLHFLSAENYDCLISAGRLALDYRQKELDSMILKMLDYENMKNEKAVKESWTYFDNITSARVTYDEDIKQTVVSCSFKNNDMVTFTVKHLAYLMSYDGKTIDRIRTAEPEITQGERVYETLQEAVRAAAEDI